MKDLVKIDATLMEHACDRLLLIYGVRYSFIWRIMSRKLPLIRNRTLVRVNAEASVWRINEK